MCVALYIRPLSQKTTVVYNNYNWPSETATGQSDKERYRPDISDFNQRRESHRWGEHKQLAASSRT
jgi:hypothetical protein